MLRTLRITQLLSNPGFAEAFGRQRPCTLTLSCNDSSSNSEVRRRPQRQFAMWPCNLPSHKDTIVLLRVLACLVPMHLCTHLTGHARMSAVPGSALTLCIWQTGHTSSFQLLPGALRGLRRLPGPSRPARDPMGAQRAVWMRYHAQSQVQQRCESPHIHLQQMHLAACPFFS